MHDPIFKSGAKELFLFELLNFGEKNISICTCSTSGESSDLGPAHNQGVSERGRVRARRCSNDEGRASKNVERPPISPAVGFDSASRHAPVMLRSPHVQPGERQPMMVSRCAERMARPSHMAPRMQVQSAIASRPACGRVCAQLLPGTARTHAAASLNRPGSGDRSPPPLHRCHCCLAIAGRPLRPRALDGRAGIRAHVRAAVGPIGAATSSCRPLPRPGTRGRREVAGARVASGWSGSGESASGAAFHPGAVAGHRGSTRWVRVCMVAPSTKGVCVCCVCVLGSRRCTMPMERACKPVLGCFVAWRSCPLLPPHTLVSLVFSSFSSSFSMPSLFQHAVVTTAAP